MSKFLLVSNICSILGLDYLSSTNQMSVVDLKSLYVCLIKLDAELQTIKEVVESRTEGV